MREPIFTGIRVKKTQEEMSFQSMGVVKSDKKCRQSSRFKTNKKPLDWQLGILADLGTVPTGNRD